MQRILVTGASGHIGGHVVRELQRQERHPVAFVRATSRVEGLEVERCVGDLLDPASLARAATGCDAVIHCAANFAIWARRRDDIVRPTVEGTANVLAAAARAGIRRVVYTSTCAAVGYSERADVLRSERNWNRQPRLEYYRAKLEAERTALRIAAEQRLDLITICPTLVLGSHDYRITPSMQPLLDLANGRGATIDGGANVVSVRDVALAHVRALDHGAGGERFLVGGENLTLRELGMLVGAITGRMPRHLRLPRWAFGVVAALIEVAAAITRKPPTLTRAAVHDVVGKYAWFDCTKARATFGIEPTPAATVVRETLRWFLERNLLRAPVSSATRAALQAAA